MLKEKIRRAGVCAWGALWLLTAVGQVHADVRGAEGASAVRKSPPCKLSAWNAVDILYWNLYGADLLLGTSKRCRRGPNGVDTAMQSHFLRQSPTCGLRVEGGLLVQETRASRFSLVVLEDPWWCSSGVLISEEGVLFSSPFLPSVGRLRLDFEARFSYWSLSYVEGRQFCLERGVRIFAFGGIGWKRFRRQMVGAGWLPNGVGVAVRRAVAQRFAGIGPALGCEATCPLYGGVALSLEARCLAVIGHNRRWHLSETFFEKRQQAVCLDSFHSSRAECTILVPVVESRLGLIYRCRLGRCALSLRAGYEYQAHFDLFRAELLPGVSARNESTLSLAGVAFGLFVCY